VIGVFGGSRIRSHDDCSVHGPLGPDDVLAMSFKAHKLGKGYDPDEVDEFLDTVAAAMAGYVAPVTAWDVRQHEFIHSGRRGGFSAAEVDDFLECVARTLEGGAG